MTTLREAAQQALEALEIMVVDVKTTPTAYEAQRQAIAALRTALAELPQEPVAWMWEEVATRSSTGIGGIDRKLLFCRPVDEPWKRNITPLYTAPPQRKPLTEGKPWVCACGANLYIDAEGKPRSKA